VLSLLKRQGIPIFNVDSKRIRFLSEPCEYLSSLESLIASSKRRVSLSGLYLGSDALSKRLVNVSLDRMRSPCPPSFNILLDHGRGTRVEHGATSVSTALPLLSLGAKLALWRTPRMGWLAQLVLPTRFKELVGVQHMKVHVIDNTVMISGANLSETYFSNRQDRYVIIDDEHVSTFFHRVLNTVIESASNVTESGTIEDPHSSNLAEALNDLWREQNASNNIISSTSGVFIAPTVQMGAMNVRIDERLTNSLLEELPNWTGVVIATGYFNLTRTDAALIANLRGAHILVASPTANPWSNSHGMSRHVPSGYSALQGSFLKKCRSSSAPKMLEWTFGAWSFHCKGLWAFRDDATLTMIGSANMGHRSVELDLEAQVLLVSECQEFREKSRLELSHIERNCVPVTAEQLTAPERTPPLIWRILLPIISRWM
jgi:CDP-diacylglycerol--glycerol-3-phosphate 3-phosphatidyltransferase